MGGKVTKGRNNMDTPLDPRAKIRNSVCMTSKGSSKSINSEKSESPRYRMSLHKGVLTESSFNSMRIKNKKQKIAITAKSSNIHKEASELSVLKVVKKNNYDFEDKDLINEILSKHFFMRCLEKEARVEVIKEMTLCQVDEYNILFKQGSIGNYFYIIKEGEFELHINGVFQRNLVKGDSFGELALLHGVPRSGTVKSTMTSLVYCLERRNFRKIVDHINALNFEENKKFINIIGILSHIDNDLKTILASQLLKQYYEANTYIVKEGDLASCLYIIYEGEVECIMNGKVIRTLLKGDHFGEKSVLLESKRTMNVVAKTNCQIYSISVETLRSMAGDKYKDVLFLNFIKMSFQQSKLLNKINGKLIENAYECFTVNDYKRFESIVKNGDMYSSKIIIVIEGNVINSRLNQVVARRGDILFEEHLSTLSNDKINMELVAEPDCLVVEADTAEFIKFLGGASSFKDLFKKSMCLDSLINIPMFKNFPHKKIELLSDMLSLEKYENGKKIIRQGEADDKFYIVKSGRVDIFVNSTYMRTLNVFESFGERALFFNEPRTATAQANGPVELYVIQSKDFKMILEDNLAEYLKNRFYLQDNSIELKDLDFVKELGHGNFGAVVQVKHRKNNFKYAVKALSKKQIDNEQLHINLELERAILLKIDHPFIVKLVKTLKTDKQIFFLLEYIRGKELFDVIRDIGLLSKTQTQFYAAQIMLAIDYLHERKCVYRDIKPENVMIGENGFIKLIDFGTVKEIVERTTTVIGTPHYMSPEVILGDGYSFAVDFWSIGVCMYEFMCGGVPFGEDADEPMDVYTAIVNNELKFPQFVKDKEFISMIKKMLSKSTCNRLCKLSHIKAEPWFQSFSWEDLISLKMEPPYYPKLPQDEGRSSHVSFVNYARTIKEWVASKNVHIERKNQQEYDDWFKQF